MPSMVVTSCPSACTARTLHDFTLPGTYREEYWDIGFGEHPISFYHLEDETVWGLTGRILKWLLEVVYDVQGRTPPTAIEPMP